MKKLYIRILLAGIIVLSFARMSEVNAQNKMSIPGVSGNANDTLEVCLNIDNSGNFVAFQTDISLPQEVKYVDGSAALTSRAAEHQLSSTLLENNVLRLIVFSVSQKSISGNSGSVLKFKIKLGTLSGNYTLGLLNPVISNLSSQNILSSSENGTVTILSPEISVSADSLDFGAVPLTQNKMINLTLTNHGNVPLNIKNIYSDNKYFEVAGLASFLISPNSSVTLGATFKSTLKGSYRNILTIESNDPDRQVVKIPLKAAAFAVNELHMAQASGRSGYPIDLTFSINNMEPFTGFQFDINLPGILSYKPGSAKLTSRMGDQIVSADLVSANKLRVIAFSASNKTFSGNSGDVLKLSFNLDGQGGSYSVNLENVIITDASGTNIMSAYSGDYVNIMSPDIHGETSINMGECSVKASGTFNYQVYNYGNDTLTVTSFSAPHEYFYNATPLPQKIMPGNSKTFELKFHNGVKGSYSDRFAIRSNDPDEDPYYVNVSASSFEPNFIAVENTEAKLGDSVAVRLNIHNYTPFTAFQTDLEFPAQFSFIPGSETLTGRKQDHTVQVASVGVNKLRIIAFSMSMKNFNDTTGAVLELKFLANSLGTYPFILPSATLSNSNSQNILKGTLDGKITVRQTLNIPPVEATVPKEYCLRQNYPNPFNPSTVIEYDMPEEGRVTLEVFNLLGEKIVTLVDEIRNAGSYKAEWKAMNQNSGIYIYRLNASGSQKNYSQIRKMILIK